MFSYYGSKSKVVDLYPSPKHDKIIEPFAGSARYSLKWFDRDVLLVDKYEVIIRIWKWLQKCSIKDILSLPVPKIGEKLTDYHFDCEEALWYMGFNINVGATSPRKTVTKYVGRDDAIFIKRYMRFTARNLYKIRHWVIELGNYLDIENQDATWFIDPPYQKGGSEYKHSDINYLELAKYCKTRKGQVIACGSMSDKWLDFYPMRINPGGGNVRRSKRTEAIWSNEPHNFMARQPSLFTPPNTSVEPTAGERGGSR